MKTLPLAALCGLTVAAYGQTATFTVLLDAPASLISGGGFRFPPQGYGATDPHYSVELQAGVTTLTLRNGAPRDIGIEHAQLPSSLQVDPVFFEPAADLDIFKFRIRAPL